MKNNKNRLTLLRSSLLTLTLLLPVASFSAQSPTDKLEAQLKTAPPNKQLALLNELAESYLGKSLQKAFDYVQQALSQARQSGNAAEEARALLTLGEYYANVNKPKDAISVGESSLGLAKNVAKSASARPLVQFIGQSASPDEQSGEGAEISTTRNAGQRVVGG